MDVPPRASDHDCFNARESGQYIFCFSGYHVRLHPELVEISGCQLNCLLIKIYSINVIASCLKAEFNCNASASTTYVDGSESFLQSQLPSTIARISSLVMGTSGSVSKSSSGIPGVRQSQNNE